MPRTIGTNSRWTLFAPAFFVLLLLGACDESAQEEAVTAAPAEVMIAEVEQKIVPIVMEFPGTVQAVKTVQIIPRVSGYVEKRYFEEGAYVETGAPLYLIDPRPFEARLASRKAQLEKDQATLAYWTSEADRFARAAKTGAVAAAGEQEAKSKRDALKAAVAQDKADIENARLDLSYTNIVAPFAGRAEDTRRYEGDLVEKHRDTLTTLVQLDPIHVVFNMNARQMAEIKRLIVKGWGLSERAQYKATVILPNGKVYDNLGRLDFVSAQIDPATDTHAMRAEFPNPRRSEGRGLIAPAILTPGQYVPLRLTVGSQPDAVVITASALVQSQLGTHVFVVDDNDTAEFRIVEIDRPYNRQWIIGKGLEPGERVIVQGVQKVRNGTVVKAMSQKSASN